MGVYIAVSSEKPLLKEEWFERRINNLVQNINIQFTESTFFIDATQNNLLIQFARNNNILRAKDQTHVAKNDVCKTNITVISGYIWEKKYTVHSKPLTAFDLAKLLKSKDIEEIRDVCNGEYSIINID